ncbi:Carboxylesterase [Nocardia sp. RB56]|uniref:Carboxylic ester hydrolase n=2 Tax=Nocardia aurantia TaxID=2585199 RepID=A0A7K0E052_9NOCA|nr:Carboxylesterase [Nocardia aurantia]
MDAVVATTSGPVRGTIEDGLTVFRGIAYAQPPVGPLRWAAPEPPVPWTEPRPAVSFGPAAPQPRPDGIVGDIFSPAFPSGEDCLSLNVWTPDPQATGLPVFVWIHGGAFLFGSGADDLIDHGSFARSGIVFVSINYRLGMDGYLYVEGDENAGNYGTLDQIAALRWVRANIAAFGGDPERVTIGGESAGGTAVAALLAAPAARGLFVRAIAQSAYPEPLLSPDSGRIVARELESRLGVPAGDLAALREVREWHPRDVTTVVRELFEDVANRDATHYGAEIAAQMNPLMPIVGGEVLPSRPVEAGAAGELADVDLLIGTNRDEFRIVFALGMMSVDDATIDAVFEATFPGRGAEALATYAAGRPGSSRLDLLAALETDRSYRVGSTLLADAHARHRPGSTWFYRFAWPSTAFDGQIGAAHAVELPFVFDALGTPMAEALTGPGAPQPLADDIHRAWVAFITTGDPNHDGLPTWPAYDHAKRRVMELGSGHRVVAAPDADELALWIGDEEGR